MGVSSTRKFRLASLDETSLGNLLVAGGVLDRERLGDLLEEFKVLDDGTLLGQFLVSKKVLTQERLEFILMKQDAKRHDGVTNEHLLKAFDIAQVATDRVSQSMEEVIRHTTKAK
jgi:hypothetical protein